MKLMIVESPGKTKKIQGFLGSAWSVMASVGHVRDLPEKELGVAAPDFKPHYVPTERGAEVLARLAAATRQADEVYLATDPDREGEAISWHLAEALQLKDPKRVTFGEITEKAVTEALARPRALDMHLVAAQEGRRVLDRLCGYMVSGPLAKAIGNGRYSAGRVQSPGVRIVVEREREIRQFKSTTHYGVELSFEAVDNITDGWKAVWNTKNWLKGDEEYILDKDLAERVAAIRNLAVADFEEAESRQAPPAPFTTSSLQQAASVSLKFKPKKTMDCAQKLYEQGCVTYMRTDSPNFSQDFVAEARAFCESQNWPLAAKPRVWKSKEGAQEAHEAVRPTHIEVEEAGENPDEQALYRLIRLRSLACQLEDAVFAGRVLQLEGEVDGKKAFFEARGRTMVSPGWKIVTRADQAEEEDEDAEAENPVPAMKSGAKATALEGRLLTKKTKPPRRYTEAALIKELEKRGIGRPSTYAAILEKINAYEYVRSDKNFLVPTERGEAVVDKLTGNFSFMDYDFTRNMEDTLDAIAAGKAGYKQCVSEAYERLTKELQAFKAGVFTPCPECGAPELRHLVKKADKKDSKEYNFWACDECKATFGDAGGKPGPKQEKREKRPQELSEYKCKAKGCGKPLVRRQGNKKDGSGAYDFYSCSDYPRCNQSYPTQDGKPNYEARQKGGK